MNDAATAQSETDTIEVGTRLVDRFVVERVLGRGATGNVYAARDETNDGQPVALKLLHRHLGGNRQVRARFHREARILTHMQGEHVARMLELCEVDDELLLVLELVDGPSLETVLEQRSRLAPALAVEIALQTCAALGRAHAQDVIHRDLKPGNILLEGGVDNGVRVRVVDFGLAKLLHGEASMTGLTERDMVFGTAEYMAPEQAGGEAVDGRCDLYALGVILFEMLIGRVPLSGRTPIATMTAQLHETPPSLREMAAHGPVPPSLADVVDKALAKDPDDRWPTARAMAEKLAVAAQDVANASDFEAFVTDDTELHLERQAEAAKSAPPKPSSPPSSPRRNSSSASSSMSPATPTTASASWWLWLLAVAAVGLAIGLGIALGMR